MADNNANPNAQNGANHDAPNIRDLVTGVVGFFNTYPKESLKIAYVTPLSGEIRIKSGFFINLPWRRKAVQISLAKHKIDTIKRTVSTLGDNSNLGPEVDYDVDYHIKVVDVEKFVKKAHAYSPSDGSKISASKIGAIIGEILDTAVSNYIRSTKYEQIIRASSDDFIKNVLGERQNGVFPPKSKAQEILEEYGVEISDITLKVGATSKMKQQAQALKEAEMNLQKAEYDNQIRRKNAETDADIKKINAEAEAEAASMLIEQMIKGGLTSEQVAMQLANKALVNGTNEHTIVMAGTALGQQGSLPGQNAAFDMTVMLQLFNQMMRQNQAQQPQQQQQTQQPRTQQQAQQPQQSTINWSSLPDTEYLSAEDSLALAAERGQNIQPGGRYHISLLTDEEKTRYHVAAQRVNTR